MKQSAGILAYRYNPHLEFFLVHPGGPFFAKKDLAVWSIPKGEFTDSEDGLKAAKREFKEETSFAIDGDFVPLKSVMQKGGKKVFAWAVEFDLDETKVVSNTFKLQWPPNSGKFKDVPEVDKGGWFNEQEAKEKINPAQIPLLDELIEKLKLQ